MFAASAEELDVPPGQVPKPYTVPPGYKAPTMGEQFRYVSRVGRSKVWSCAMKAVVDQHSSLLGRGVCSLAASGPPVDASLSNSLRDLPFSNQAAVKHPYARLGYAGALLLGLLGWAIATQEKKHPHQPLGAHTKEQHEGGGGSK